MAIAIGYIYVQISDPLHANILAQGHRTLTCDRNCLADATCLNPPTSVVVQTKEAHLGTTVACSNGDNFVIYIKYITVINYLTVNYFVGGSLGLVY